MMPFKTLKKKIETLANLPSSKVQYLRILNGTSLPYVTLSEISARRSFTHNGNTNLLLKRVQISIFCETYTEAKDLANKLFPIQSFVTEEIVRIKIENEIDFFDSEARAFGVSIDLMVYMKTE